MANYSQIIAWQKLEHLFGQMPRWRRRTNREYFERLDSHVATHHLLMLIADFLGIRVYACCDFAVRDERPSWMRPQEQASTLPDLAAIELPESKEPAAVQQPDLLATMS